MNYRVTKIVAGALTLLMCASTVFSFATVTSAEPFEYRVDLPPLDIAVSWAAAATVGDSIYVIGGCLDYVVDVPPTVSTVQIYNVDTGEVTFGTPMPKGVCGAAYGLGPDGKIYIAGGWNASDSSYYQRVQIYDPALDNWTEAAANVPSPIGRSASAMSPDGMLYVFGGGWTMNVTMIYNTQTDVWDYGMDLPTPSLDGDAVVVSPTQVFYLDFASPSSEVLVYDPVLDSWTNAAPMPYSVAWGSSVLARNGCIYVFGGSSLGESDPTPMDSVLRYSVADDTWVTTGVNLNSGLTHSCAVVDSYGRVVVLGGYDGSSVVPDVESFFVADISGEYQIHITSPQDGDSVSGVVEVKAESINSWGSWFVGVDLLVDGALYDSQTFIYTATFIWNTTGLPDGSTHTLTARGYNWDGTVVEDSVTVTVYSMSAEEQIEQQIAMLQMSVDILQLQIGALGMALLQVNASLSENLTAINAQMDYLFGQLAILQAALTQIGNGLTTMGAAQQAAMDQLNATLVDLRGQLDDFQEQIDRIENKADTAGTYGIVTMVLVLIIVLLLVVMLMMARKKP